jgi:hypothetical protein
MKWKKVYDDNKLKTNKKTYTQLHNLTDENKEKKRKKKKLNKMYNKHEQTSEAVKIHTNTLCSFINVYIAKKASHFNHTYTHPLTHPHTHAN